MPGNNHNNSTVQCSAIILAGGLNSRMGGTNKAFLDVGGKTIIQRIHDAIEPFFTEKIIVTRKPELYRDMDFRIVEDIYQTRSSLTGIHAGLAQTSADFGFVLPCDAPFIQPSLIEAVLGRVTPESDVVVPLSGKHYQPLCAVYSTRCLTYIEEMIRQENFKVTGFFDKVRVTTIPEEELYPADPSQQSFINVNTPDVYSSWKDKN